MDELMNRLIDDKDVTVREASGEAYDIAFGDNHNTLVRKGCKMAIYWAPSRDKFKTLLKIDDVAQLQKSAQGFKIVRQSIEQLFKDINYKV